MFSGLILVRAIEIELHRRSSGGARVHAASTHEAQAGGGFPAPLDFGRCVCPTTGRRDGVAASTAGSTQAQASHLVFLRLEQGESYCLVTNL